MKQAESKRKTALHLILLLLTCSMLLPLAGCNGTRTSGDTVTMYVGLGNTGTTYYASLHQIILDQTGIDVQFVFNRTLDTTDAVGDCLANEDAPADIIITARRESDDVQKTAFLDLATYTNIPDLFTNTKMRECSLDGAIYQIPFTSRLIGIEYNKTLLEEMGWQLPSTYADMVALKAQVESAGYTFAVSGGVATGHGFNYLFNVMGAQYLSSPNGTEWLSDFLAGETDATDFEEQSAYLKKYIDSGLFGVINYQNWNASSKYCRTRALFYYNIINDCVSYDGFRYNEDGTLYGAVYSGDGILSVIPDAEGEAVYYNGEYIPYDADNEALAGLQRYHIPGVEILHDTYASMPWISEGGSSNCYVMYDSMYVGLSKDLSKTKNKSKLDMAIKVLKAMASDEAADLFCGLYSDGYVATKNFSLNEDRMYADYADSISQGYLMPWYYNEFDTDSIVNVGEIVNNYMQGKSGVDFASIFDELETRRDNHLQHTEETIATAVKTFDYADSAKIQAIANALSLQKAIDASEMVTGDVQVSILPYIHSIDELPLYTSLGVVQQKIYKGPVQKSMLKSYISDKSSTAVAIRLSGAEIKRIISEGYKYTDEDGNVYLFDYTYVTKDNITLDNNQMYIVAVPKASLTEERLTACENAGTVLEGVTGSTEEGLMLAAEKPYSVFSGTTVVWNSAD